MIKPINPPQITPERHKEMLEKTMSDTMELLSQFKTQFGGKLPEELSYGMVAGYLHGKGHTWEESFVAMHQFIVVVKNNYGHAVEVLNGTMKMSGTENSADFKYAP